MHGDDDHKQSSTQEQKLKIRCWFAKIRPKDKFCLKKPLTIPLLSNKGNQISFVVKNSNCFIYNKLKHFWTGLP